MKFVELTYNWYQIFKSGAIDKEQLTKVVELHNAKVAEAAFEKFATTLSEEEREKFKEFLTSFNMMRVKKAKTSGNGTLVSRINSITKYNSIISAYDGNVPISPEDYLELTNTIVEAQAKLNKVLRPVFELRVYIHKNK